MVSWLHVWEPCSHVGLGLRVDSKLHFGSAQIAIDRTDGGEIQKSQHLGTMVATFFVLFLNTHTKYNNNNNKKNNNKKQGNRKAFHGFLAGAGFSLLH